MTVGDVIAATAMAGLIFSPFSRVADMSYTFEQSWASVQRLAEVLAMKPEVAERAGETELIGRARGLIEFDRVSFHYTAGVPVIRDLQLRIEPGTRVAIIGTTGSGKSTLVNLLLRFYEPTEGEIRLDGVPLQRLGLGHLRRQFGVVLQDPSVLRMSIAENIRYGSPRATLEQVEAAARAALIHDFVMYLPDGYATVVGEGAYPLSDGQAQRLAIARALCRDPAIVVLDEATSSLDEKSEALVRQGLENLLRGRTCVVIAHRLASIIAADQIVVVEQGRIVQVGTHRQRLRNRDEIDRKRRADEFRDQGAVREPVEVEAPAPLVAGLVPELCT